MDTNNARYQKQLNQVLRHLYINPLEKCNLRCKICYTKKTDPILTQKQILDFIDRYQNEYDLQTITFCGGEVFALKYYTDLLNILNSRGIFTQTITNGTIDHLDKIVLPNLNNLIVSIDGLAEYHDSNRGAGNFHKSMHFLKKAHKLNLHTEIFSIVTKQNMDQIDIFENYMRQELGKVSITYHPRKPQSYLAHHPISNIEGEISGFDYLTDSELVQIMQTRNTFPPKELGCYQISLASTGIVYGCCEGFRPIGNIGDPIEKLVYSLRNRIGRPCLGCSQTEFMCGIKHIINKMN